MAPPIGEQMAGGYAPPPSGATGGPDPSQNVLSIIGIVTGILGGFCCVLFSIIGLVLGVIAYTRKEPLAMWALIASGAGIVISLGLSVLSFGPSFF